MCEQDSTIKHRSLVVGLIGSGATYYRAIQSISAAILVATILPQTLL